MKVFAWVCVVFGLLAWLIAVALWFSMGQDVGAQLIHFFGMLIFFFIGLGALALGLFGVGVGYAVETAADAAGLENAADLGEAAELTKDGIDAMQGGWAAGAPKRTCRPAVRPGDEGMVRCGTCTAQNFATDTTCRLCHAALPTA